MGLPRRARLVVLGLLAPAVLLAVWPAVGGATATWFHRRTERAWIDAFGSDATFLPALSYGETNPSGAALAELAESFGVGLLERSNREEDDPFALRRAAYDHVGAVARSTHPVDPPADELAAGLDARQEDLAAMARILLQDDPTFAFSMEEDAATTPRVVSFIRLQSLLLAGAIRAHAREDEAAMQQLLRGSWAVASLATRHPTWIHHLVGSATRRRHLGVLRHLPVDPAAWIATLQTGSMRTWQLHANSGEVSYWRIQLPRAAGTILPERAPTWLDALVTPWWAPYARLKSADDSRVMLARTRELVQHDKCATTLTQWRSSDAAPAWWNRAFQSRDEVLLDHNQFAGDPESLYDGAPGMWNGLDQAAVDLELTIRLLELRQARAQAGDRWPPPLPPLDGPPRVESLCTDVAWAYGVSEDEIAIVYVGADLSPHRSEFQLPLDVRLAR